MKLLVCQADVITVAASRLKPLYVKDEWMKEGVTLLITGPMQTDDSFWMNTNLIYDNVRLHEAYVQEAVESGDIAGYYRGVIGGPIYTLIDAGKITPLAESTSIGDVIREPNRAEQMIRREFPLLPVVWLLLMWVWAMTYIIPLWKKGIGTKLTLWDDPYQK